MNKYKGFHLCPRLAAALLALCLALGLMTGTAFADARGGGFADMPEEGHWSYEALAWAVDKGVLNGVTEELLCPDGFCTRAQVLTMIWRMAGEPTVADGTISFEDVFADAYYAPAVRWAVTIGVTDGVTDTMFLPDRECTRAEAVTMVFRTIRQLCPPPMETSQPAPARAGKADFVDVSETEYYYYPVVFCRAWDIADGVDETHFLPDGRCSRAQAAAFLYRAARTPFLSGIL